MKALLPALFAISTLAASLSAQGGCRDQSYVPASVNNGLEITANQWVTQTFTVGRTGTLSRIDIVNINHHRGTPTQPLEVRIVATDATGVPNGAMLATVTFQPNQVPASRGRLAVDVSNANIPVSAGQVLGIRLSSAAAPSTQTYAWWGETPGQYAAGQIYLRDTTALSVWDLSFETFVGMAASWRNYGTGHAGTNGIPTLTTTASPILGTTIDLDVANSSNSASTGLMLVGFRSVNLPTPVGGNLLVQFDAAVSLSLPAGGLRISQAIPNQPNLCGLSVFWQAIQMDAGGSFGVSFTPGLELVLGS